MQIERALPDDGWQRAADVALRVLEPWARSKPEYVKLVLEPLRAPDGSTVEHMLKYDAYTATGRDFGSRVLVANGVLVDQPAPETAEQFLRDYGFPKRRIERGLLYELMLIYGVVTTAWVSPPSQAGWDILDRADRDSTAYRKHVELVYKSDGATLTILRGTPDHDPKSKRLVDRFVIQFDRTAQLTISSAREQPDGSWTPIPPAP